MENFNSGKFEQNRNVSIRVLFYDHHFDLLEEIISEDFP